MNLFITGATGFLGKAVLAKVLPRDRYDRIFLLARPGAKSSAADRVEKLIHAIFPPSEAANYVSKVVTVQGDLTEPDIGLSRQDRAMLVEQVDQILHIGASTDFGAPLEESRQYNVAGTRSILDMAVEMTTKGRLKRLEYVSTAYVAGDRRGRVDEMTLVRNQSFANNYERSKFEAECLVNEYMSKVNIAVYRPSIIVGDSLNGYTPHFKVLYWPIRILAKNLLPFVPCDPNARLDVVPVDFVARSIVALMEDPEAIGQTWHLTVGEGQEITIKELLADAERFSGVRRKVLLPFWMFRVLKHSPARGLFDDVFWQTAELAAPYTSYLRGNSPAFCARKTHARLAEKGIVVPRWKEYRSNIFRYCNDSAWGRRVKFPEYFYYQAN
jgi:long-chain acyl-CoA synthetase